MFHHEVVNHTWLAILCVFGYGDSNGKGVGKTGVFPSEEMHRKGVAWFCIKNRVVLNEERSDEVRFSIGP